MGFRFEWRPRIAPGIRLNFSKRGLSSISVGQRGAWLNFNKRGTRTSVGAPGSGLRWTSDLRPYGARTRGVWWLVGATTLALLLLYILAIPLGHARGTERSVQRLKEQCEKQADNDGIYCIGYISGIVEMMNLLREAEPDTRTFAICQDQNTTYGADMQAFLNWANKHPEEWSKPMVFGVITALRETWPCKQ